MPPTALQSQLERSIRGQVRFDRLARALYATDASIYEIIPAGVVLPRDRRDMVATVNLCRDHGVPIVPRGAGTGLTGGAVGAGIQLDCSRYMNEIGDLDLDACTVRVQPGVVLDELNAFIAPHGLHFAPDVATSSRATIGGMIANNSCGARSVIYQRTVDHVEALTVVLADGSVVTWGVGRRSESRKSNVKDREPRGDLRLSTFDLDGSADHIAAELEHIADTYRAEIDARFPKVLRRNGGYALDRICTLGRPINPAAIVCGSEGTLCLIAEAVLKLTSLPKCKALLLVHFEHLLDALSATPAILNHHPAAVELVDRMIIEAAARDPVSSAAASMIDMNAQALLMVEFFDDTPGRLEQRLRQLRQDLAANHVGHAHRLVTDTGEQKAVWDMRRRGLGLLMSRPGDERSYAFVEDSAVDPSRLRDYIERFGAILTEEGVRQAGYYAHAGVGVIHVRPVLNLKTARDVTRMQRIADRISSLALEFGGAMTGEHGDGIVRSCWNEKMYGPKIVQAFRQVKRAFDPDGLFNPGKIVDPLPMTENLRFGPGYRSQSVKTHLDFSAHGGPAGMAEMCSGLGECRRRTPQPPDSSGARTMCPSYMATGDETHTTRARANALRIALSNRGLLDGLADPALDEVMDLCLLCKACKSECPTGVDMARLKVEWLSAKNMAEGVPRRARFIAQAPRLAGLGSRFPRFSNLILQSSPVRALLEHRYGLDRRAEPPRFARTTFHQWFRRHRREIPAAGAPEPPDSSGAHPHRPRVVYYADTWTNYYTPQVGIAAVTLLEAAGFRVLAPRFRCCGRPLISYGLLTEAKHHAELNIEHLARFADAGTPIVGTEPSCILTLVDEYPQLVPTADARAVAKLAQPLESFLAALLRDDPHRIRFAANPPEPPDSSGAHPSRHSEQTRHSERSEESPRRILYHGHCHQKAHGGTTDAITLLNHPPGFSATQINSGCCGMAGAFGYEKEHYLVAKAIGEQRLFPAVRNRDGADVAVSGFSCRLQIAHHTAVTPLHPAELLAAALDR